MVLQPFGWALVAFQFLNPMHKSVGLFGPGISRLKAFAYIQTQNKLTQISVPSVGFESTTIMIVRAKKIHALDRLATVMVRKLISVKLNFYLSQRKIMHRNMNFVNHL
jgi:hypothetical protein